MRNFFISGPDLTNSTTDGFPNGAVERDNCIVSQGKRIHTKNVESIEVYVLKQKQLCVVVAASVVVS